MHCIDYSSHDINLYSSWVFDADYEALDIMAVPCGTKIEGDPEPVRDDCEWDKYKVLDFLSTSATIIYHNQG